MIRTELYRQLPLHAIAKGFVAHQYRFSVDVPGTQQQIWDWLNDTATFTKGQIWPYRVEFVSPDPDHIPEAFAEGVLNVHHGPWLNFAGVLTEIRPNEYRDLQYFYGSYALTQRWIRPNRLQFWLSPLAKGGTTITCQVDSYVKPFISGAWTTAQRLFWSQFKTQLKRI